MSAPWLLPFSASSRQPTVLKLMFLGVVFAEHCTLCDITEFAQNGTFQLKEPKRHDEAIDNDHQSGSKVMWLQ